MKLQCHARQVGQRRDLDLLAWQHLGVLDMAVLAHAVLLALSVCRAGKCHHLGKKGRHVRMRQHDTHLRTIGEAGVKEHVAPLVEAAPVGYVLHFQHSGLHGHLRTSV